MNSALVCDRCGTALPFTFVDCSACEDGDEEQRTHAISTHVSAESGHLATSGDAPCMGDHDCHGPDDEWDLCEACGNALAAWLGELKIGAGK